MPTIQTYPAHDLPEPLARAAIALKQRVWPSDQTETNLYAEFLDRHRQRPDRYVILAMADDTLLAHAEVFTRELVCDGDTLRVGCLAGVCVLPERRGEGLGRRVVEAALAASHGDGLPVVLFQTGVPEFYRKLGAERVHNRFIDSLAASLDANPWWDEHVMIHPGDHPWPRGTVDLRGGAF